MRHELYNTPRRDIKHWTFNTVDLVDYMKGWVLDKEEKECSDWLLTFFDYKKLDCWNHTAPPDFENHKPCEDSKHW